MPARLLRSVVAPAAQRMLPALLALTNIVFAADVRAAAPRKPARIIEYYGDSTVWGYNPRGGGQVATPAPTAFASALPASRRYEVRNEGVNGSTACALLYGSDGKHVPWQQQMAASRASFVFVNFGINDEWKYDVNMYKSCLYMLAQTARQYGKQVIFETPNPTRDSRSDGLDVYVDAMRDVADQGGIPLIDQYRYLTAYLDGRSPYTICPDGLHPDQETYIKKGKYAAQIFLQRFPGR
jgi:lysophospholipase L1-like esterase